MAETITTDTAAWLLCFIVPPAERGGYMQVWQPCERDRAYLAFTAANLAGDVAAMRTAAHVIEDGRA